ncbi:LysM peptidoglycan-binding domain-containing protein [Azospirillum sp. sgz301742]
MRKVLILLAITLLPAVASVLGYWAGFRINLAAWMPPTPPAPEEPEPQAAMPPEWREDAYLARNPDVAAAVRSGVFRSGYDHYLRAGLREGRRGGLPDGMTLPPVPTSTVAAAPPSAPAPAPVQEPVPVVAAPVSPPPVPPTSPPVVTATPPASVPVPPPAPVVQQAPMPAPTPPAPEAPVRYVVRSGGALARVAELNGTTVMELLRANPGLKDGWLAPGTALNLPLNREQSTAPPPVLAAIPPVPPPKPGGASVGPVPTPATERPAAVTVHSIRMGEHPPVTRIVLDLSGPLDVPAIVRPNATSVVLALAGARWNTTPRWSADRHPVLSSYQVTNGPEGSRLDIRARTAVEVRQIAVHSPNGERGYRVIVDLVPAGR